MAQPPRRRASRTVVTARASVRAAAGLAINRARVTSSGAPRRGRDRPAAADLDVVHRHASRDDRLLDFSRQDREGALYYGTLVGDPALIARQVDGALPEQQQRDDFGL